MATFHGAWSIENQKQNQLIDPVLFAEILKQSNDVGYGHAPYPGAENFGVSLSKASAIMEIASAITNIRIIGYQERGWANNHDVLMLTKNDRLAPF